MISLRHGDWRDVLADVECDAIICDPPYSAKTHAGHDASAKTSKAWIRSNGRPDSVCARRAISYAPWGVDDVDAFVDHWSPRTRGWFVVVTDDVLAPLFAAQLERHGRYVFAPLPLVETGSRVRLTGDGPSSWTCWIVVARPRTPEFVKWGTLPGAYVVPRESKAAIGGKPLKAMREIVRDYSRPGDLICDPCAGRGATTLRAAKLEGRSAIGAEINREDFEVAAELVTGIESPRSGRTISLFGTEEA